MDGIVETVTVSPLFPWQHLGAKSFLRPMPPEIRSKGVDPMVTYGEPFQLIQIVTEIVTLVVVLCKMK